MEAKIDWDAFSIEDLIRFAELKLVSHPANSYVPNGAQANFIRLFGGAPMETYEKHRYTWVEAERPDNFLNFDIAANSTGKTDAEILVCGQMIGATDNPYFYDDSGRLFPFYAKYPKGCKGRIISTPAAIRDTIVPRILELFPEGSYKKEKRGHKDYYNYFEGPRGFFDLMTYEQDLSEFESITLNFAFFDEPPERQEIFLATTARGRKGMRIGFVLTPLKGAAWLHDVATGQSEWTVGSVYAQMEVNCNTHGLRGALEHEHLQEISAGWSEEEREARVHAKWMHLAGQVYHMFDPLVHVVDPAEIPEVGTVYCTMDPHTRRPNFIGWFKVCPNGRIYMIREWPEVIEHQTTRGGRPHTKFTWYEDLIRDKNSYDQYCEIIRGVEDEIGVSGARVMDGRFGNTAYGDGSEPYYMEFNKRGMRFQLSANDPYLYRGHNRVKALIHHQNALKEKDGEPTILPRLFISSRCRNTIKAFESYVYDPKKEGDSEAVKETWKDPMDVVRLMSDRKDWRYRDPATMQKWDSTFSN